MWTSADRGVRADQVPFPPSLHAAVPGGEDSRLAERAGRRAQAGHGAVRGLEGLDGALGGSRSRRRPQASRPGPRAHDGVGPPLRGHRQPGDGRWDHGAVRGARRPRRPRGPRLLCGLADAGAREGLRRSSVPHPRITVRIRVGLNSGEVVVRSIRSDLRLDYSAVGQTTHLAARMEQLASPGSVWMTAQTLRLVESFVQARPLGPVPVHGLDTPIEVFELIGAGQARTRFQASALRGLSRFVGRNAEMEQLRTALEGARRGHGEVVAVMGEPGVGKSRLFHELTHSDRAVGCRILHASAASYARAIAYSPVIDLIRALFGIDERYVVGLLRAKATGHLLTLDEALKHLLPPVLWLLEALPEGDRFWDLEPPQRSQLTLDAIKRLLCRESQVQPLIVVLEDLHWIDPETQALLDSLVESLPGAPVLLLVNYRPEYGHAWTGKTYYRQLRIDPLLPESAEELLQA